MKLLQLKTGAIIDSEEVSSLIINGERESYSKKLLFDSIKRLVRIELILTDGSIIKDTDVREFYLISF